MKPRKQIKINLDELTPEQLELFWDETFKPNRYARAKIRLPGGPHTYRCGLLPSGLAGASAVSLALGHYALYRLRSMEPKKSSIWREKAEQIYRKLPACCQWRPKIQVRQLVKPGEKFRKGPGRKRKV